MMLAAQILAGLVALIHVYIFVLESFLWAKPFGRKTFAMSAEQAEATRVLAFNQGFYNLFLAAGLVWGLGSGGEMFARVHFFLVVVFLAGLVGGFTASRKILFVQSLPALLALLALIAARHS